MSELEKSKLWKQSVELVKVVDEIGRMIPGPDYYNITDPLHRTAIVMSSDIAMSVGRDELKESEYELRASRGRLFTIKGLLLLAQDYKYIDNIDSALVLIETMKRELDDKLQQIKQLKEEDNKK